MPVPAFSLLVTEVEQPQGDRPDLSWQSRDAAWWVKLRRAGVHIREVAAGIESFTMTQPWTVETEPGEHPDEVTHRFRVHHEPPTDLLAVIGDAVHNLRSALDAMTYGIASIHTGPLSQQQEEATAFPICETEDAFTKHMGKRNKGQTPGDLYGPNGIAGLRCVQPFAFADEARALGVEVPRTSEEDLKGDTPYRLHALWNVDKHRRLPRLAWFFDLVYYSGDPVPWQQMINRQTVINDGDVLAHHRFPNPADSRPLTPHWEISLTLADDPWPYATDVVELLTSWQRFLGGWAVPRAFYVATTGNPPPVMIPGGWPYASGS